MTFRSDAKHTGTSCAEREMLWAGQPARVAKTNGTKHATLQSHHSRDLTNLVFKN
jgi:hypothetical protein